MKLSINKMLILVLCTICQLGYSQQDSFYEKEKGWRRAYYVKPVIGWFHQKIAIIGDAQFKMPYSGPTYKPPYGILIGYRHQNLEVETGLYRIPVYTGFFFPSLVDNGSFLGVGETVSTSYGHVPLLIRYNRAFLHRKFLIGIHTGIAFNRRDTSFDLGRRSVSIFGTTDKNGNEIIIKIVNDNHYKTIFFSGEVGLTGLWQLHKRLGVSLEVRQLFSASDVARLSSTVEQNSSPTIFKVLATGGANGQSVLLGASYYF